MLFDMLEV